MMNQHSVQATIYQVFRSRMPTPAALSWRHAQWGTPPQSTGRAMDQANGCSWSTKITLCAFAIALEGYEVMALSLAVFRASQPARASAYSQAPAGLSGLLHAMSTFVGFAW